jgi:hypothetical protein
VQPVREPIGRADGNGRLADHEGGAVQMGRQPVDDRVDVAQVGGVLALLLRRAHAQEVHVAERRDLGVRRGEPQPAGLHVLAEQRLQVGLEERDPTLRQGGDLLVDDVHAEDLEAELGHARGMGGAEVAGAEHADAEGHGALG